MGWQRLDGVSVVVAAAVSRVARGVGAVTELGTVLWPGLEARG